MKLPVIILLLGLVLAASGTVSTRDFVVRAEQRNAATVELRQSTDSTYPDYGSTATAVEEFVVTTECTESSATSSAQGVILSSVSLTVTSSLSSVLALSARQSPTSAGVGNVGVSTSTATLSISTALSVSTFLSLSTSIIETTMLSTSFAAPTLPSSFTAPPPESIVLGSDFSTSTPLSILSVSLISSSLSTSVVIASSQIPSSAGVPTTTISAIVSLSFSVVSNLQSSAPSSSYPSTLASASSSSVASSAPEIVSESNSASAFDLNSVTPTSTIGSSSAVASESSKLIASLALSPSTSSSIASATSPISSLLSVLHTGFLQSTARSLALSSSSTIALSASFPQHTETETSFTTATISPTTLFLTVTTSIPFGGSSSSSILGTSSATTALAISSSEPIVIQSTTPIAVIHSAPFLNNTPTTSQEHDLTKKSTITLSAAVSAETPIASVISMAYSFTQPGKPIASTSTTTQMVSLLQLYSGPPVAAVTIHAYGTPPAPPAGCTCSVPVTVTITQILTQQAKTVVPDLPASAYEVETVISGPTMGVGGSEQGPTTTAREISSSTPDSIIVTGTPSLTSTVATESLGKPKVSCAESYSFPGFVGFAYLSSKGDTANACSTSLVTEASLQYFPHSTATSSGALYSQTAELPTSLIADGMTSINSSTLSIVAPTVLASSTVTANNTVLTTPYYGKPHTSNSSSQLSTGGAKVNAGQGQSFKLAFLVGFIALFILV